MTTLTPTSDALIPTPLGTLRAVTDGDTLTRLTFIDAPPAPVPGGTAVALRLDRRSKAMMYRHLPSVKDDTGGAPESSDRGDPATDPLAAAAAQLAAYFRGDRTAFTLPLRPAGTLFQRDVWDALQTIPYGETRSYTWLANAVGRPAAVRAVARANAANPLWIVTPCHRVIGRDGTLRGYAGGVDRKQALLKLESRAATSR